MECAAFDTATAAVMPLRSREHFTGGLSCKGEQQHRTRVDTALHEMQDAILYSPRLAGTGSGNDQHRPFNGRGRTELRDIKPIFYIEHFRTSLPEPSSPLFPL